MSKSPNFPLPTGRMLTFDELVELCHRDFGEERGMTLEETRYWVEVAIAQGVIEGQEVH